MQQSSLRLATCIGLLALLFLAACSNRTEQTVAAPQPSAVERKADSAASVYQSQQTRHRHNIEISKMQFNPLALTIHAGDTVVWTNNGLTDHCITEINKKWTSATLAPGKSWEKVIEKNTDYYCAIHLVMKGKITVE